MNLEPMLLLAIAEERRRRLLEEAERERLVRSEHTPSHARRAGVGDAVRSVLGRTFGSELSSLP